MKLTMQVIGLAEMKETCIAYGMTIKPTTMDGLRDGVREVIQQARMNFASTPPSGTKRGKKGKPYQRTGGLERSLEILEERSDDLLITAGSNLDYAYYQEMGYHSRGGRWISGKFFFRNASELKRLQILELMRSRIMAVKWGK